MRYRSFLTQLTLGTAIFSSGSGFGVASQLIARPIMVPVAVESPMPKALRQQILDKVWSEISTRYYDPQFNGVDWPAVHDRFTRNLPEIQDSTAFYRTLNQMLVTLRDGHTQAYSPRQVADRKTQQGVSLGLTLAVDGTILAVAPGSEAGQAGLKAGMQIVSIDGQAVAERAAMLRAELSLGELPSLTRAQNRLADRLIAVRLLRGDPGTTASFEVAGTGGESKTVTLTRKIVARELVVTSKLLPSGFGYVKFDNFKSKPAKEVEAAIRGFQTTASGLVIDLRQNGGGDPRVAVKMTGWFFDRTVPYGRIITRDGKPASLFGGLYKVPLLFEAGDAKSLIYSQPVVILTSEQTGSAAEGLASAMRENGRATLIGGLTCGCANIVLGTTKLPDGGELAFSNLGSRSSRGAVIEGNGIEPDVTVEPTLADVRSGNDPALGAAVRSLTDMAAKTPPEPRILNP